MIGTLLLAAAAGFIGWTLTEYTLHRFVFHAAKPRTEGAREHLRHHRDITYFTATSYKARTALLVLPPVGTASALIGGLWPGLTFTVAFLGAYLGYEWFHWSCHERAPRTAFGRWARKHHFAHHFHVPGSNHGVTCPWWDLVFFSHRPIETVVMPERQALSWLIDPETGDVRPEYADDYAIRRAA